jgi:hypothetical protein
MLLVGDVVRHHGSEGAMVAWGWGRSELFWTNRRIWRAVQDLLKSEPGVMQTGTAPRRRSLWRRQAWLYASCASIPDCERLFDRLLALGCRQISLRTPDSIWIMPTIV